MSATWTTRAAAPRRARHGEPRIVVVSHACVVDVNQEPFLALAARGVPVHVIAPKQLRTDVRGVISFSALDGIQATPLATRIGGFRRGVRQAGVHLILYRGLGAAVASLQPDVLYAEEEPWSFTTLQVARLARRMGIPYAFHQSQNVDKKLPPPFETIRRRVLSTAAGATVRLDGPAEILRRHGFDKPMLQIPNTVDPSRFEGARAAYPSLERPVYGFVGRLVPEKGIMDFLRAVASIRAHTGAGSALVAGQGPMEAEARGFAAQSGVPVTFTGPVEHGAIAGVYASMDVCAIPSRATKSWREQFGRVVIEANATGVAVVATNSGALGDTVRATGGGVVVPEGDEAALASTLGRLGTDAAERARYAAAGRDAVRERFTAAAVAGRLHEFFLQLEVPA